jgi:hypothetical protein
MKHKYQFSDIHDMLNSPEWDGYEHDNLGLQGRILSRAADPEVVTHADVLQAERDFIECVLRGDISQKKEAHLLAQVNAAEKWHAQHGTLDEEVYNYGGE